MHENFYNLLKLLKKIGGSLQKTVWLWKSHSICELSFDSIEFSQFFL